MCVCETERKSVCVRERESDTTYVDEVDVARERERERMCGVYACVRQRKHANESERR